jgi:hypothetical protein
MELKCWAKRIRRSIQFWSVLECTALGKLVVQSASLKICPLRAQKGEAEFVFGIANWRQASCLHTYSHRSEALETLCVLLVLMPFCFGPDVIHTVCNHGWNTFCTSQLASEFFSEGTCNVIQCRNISQTAPHVFFRNASSGLLVVIGNYCEETLACCPLRSSLFTYDYWYIWIRREKKCN